MENCEWILEENLYETTWMSGCSNAFWFDEGSALDNGFAYCPFCGRALTQRVPDADTEYAEEVAE